MNSTGSCSTIISFKAQRKTIKNARTMQTEINGTFRSMKNSSLNFRKFALTNGTAFSEIYEHKGRFPTRSPGLLIKLNFRCEIRNFPWATGTEFSSVKNDKPEFFLCKSQTGH